MKRNFFPASCALSLVSGILFFPFSVWGQPYYAAKKGLSCAACHVSPSGGGMRLPRETSPGRVNDAVAIGADFRFALKRLEAASDATFVTARQNLYVLAQPQDQLLLMLANNQGTTAEAYGMLKDPDRPVYLKAGRFFIPYGLQLADADNSGLTRIAPFAPTVGFSMAPTQSDSGLEIGLMPKKDYFVNVSLTNGAASGGADSSDAKAVTARWGFIQKAGALGATFYRNKTLGAGGEKEQRYGLFGWTRWGPLVLLGEGGWGLERLLATQERTNLRSLHAELDYDLKPDLLLLRGRFEHLDPNTAQSGDSRRRLILGSEWFPFSYLAFEAQCRIIEETPRTNNNEGLLLTHFWF